jgi:two-component system phosphate regulon response regulator PhoB
MPARILIVEHEKPLALFLRRNLEAAGYKVDAVERHDDFETRLRESVLDLVVLDSLPRERTGSDLCRTVRAYADIVRMPIITLVARDEDGLRALDAGADDFVVKPLSVPELLARVRALLRRVAPTRATAILRAADVELDRECHRVTRAKRDLQLGPTEFRLLEYLMRSPGRVFSREHLLEGVWGPNANIDVRTVDVHIGRLRKALKIGNRTDLVRTVRGAGYSFKQERSLLANRGRATRNQASADETCRRYPTWR